VKIVVTLNIDFVRKGILIGSVAKLGSGSGGVSTIRNLSQSSALPMTIIEVVSILQMVFTTLIMTTHVNMTAYQPLMNSMATRRYRSADAMHPRRGYQEPILIIVPILNHRDGHYVRQNMVVLKYPNFEKDVDPNVHVSMFNFVVKINAKTFKKYIINVFSYVLRNMTSEWCHNYMSKFPNYTFSKLT